MLAAQRRAQRVRALELRRVLILRKAHGQLRQQELEIVDLPARIGIRLEHALRARERAGRQVAALVAEDAVGQRRVASEKVQHGVRRRQLPAQQPEQIVARDALEQRLPVGFERVGMADMAAKHAQRVRIAEGDAVTQRVGVELQQLAQRLRRGDVGHERVVGIFFLRRLRLEADGDDAVSAEAKRRADRQIVRVRAVEVVLPVDLAHRKHRVARRRREDPLRQVAGCNVLLAHLDRLERRETRRHESEIHRRGEKARLVEILVHERAVRRDVRRTAVEVRPVLHTRDELLRVLSQRRQLALFVRRGVGALEHDLLFRDVRPELPRTVKIALHHQRRRDRTDGRARNDVKRDAQLPHRLPRADLIRALRAAAGQRDRLLHGTSLLGF